MAQWTVRPYQDADEAIWDDFVLRSINGTIFHRQRFLGYHPRGRFEDASCMLYRGGALVGVFPGALVRREPGITLRSHPGSSYGGLVIAGPPGARMADEMVEAVIRHAIDLGCDRLEFRTAPRVFSSMVSDEVEFAWWRRGFVTRELELSTCYDLARVEAGDCTDEDIVSTFSRDSSRASTRKGLRAGLKTRLCDEPALFRQYWSILEEGVARHGATPTHTVDEMLDLKARFPDKVQLVGVFRDDELIAGVVVFVANRTAVHVFYMAGRMEYREICPMNVGVLRSIRYARDLGARFLNFGISTEDRGAAMNWGLFLFKEGFGGQGVVRSYWTGDLPS